LQKYYLCLTFYIWIRVSFSILCYWNFGEFSQKKLIEFSTRKTFFPKKKSILFVQKSNQNSDQDVSHNCPDIQICMPMDHIDCLLSLTSVKQRSTVLEKISTFHLGYIYIMISETFSISLTVGLTLRKILWRKGTSTLIKTWTGYQYIEGIHKIPQTRSSGPHFFSQTGGKKNKTRIKIVHKNKRGDQTSFLT